MRLSPFYFLPLLFLLLTPTSSHSQTPENTVGRILLQVEANGEAWYVAPDSEERYYLRDGEAAYSALESFGLGITNADLAKIPVGTEDYFEASDSDEDGLSDKTEEALGTDPYNRDSDGDGYSDGTEVADSYNPLGQGQLELDTEQTERLQGYILLQVESQGQAWYVNPADAKRYYVQDGNAAYEIMRYLSLGITNAELELIPVSALSPEPGEEATEPEPEPAAEADVLARALNLDESTIDVLLVTTEALETTSELIDKLSEYIETMESTEGLTTAYLEIDSTSAQDEIGIYLADYTDWLEVKDALEDVVEAKNVEYLILLGGEQVVPMPVLDDVPNGTYDPENPTVDSVDGDNWYLDYNDDYLPDDGLVISRIADYGTGTTVILDYLDTAIKLHELGGITFDSPVLLQGESYCVGDQNCYEYPPYCVDSDPACGCVEEFMYELLSSADLIRFSGHGSRFGFVFEGCTAFSVNHIEEVELDTHNPLVIGYHSCDTGLIHQNQQTNATEFLNSGASIFAGRTETLGIYQYFVDNFPERGLAEGQSVGRAFFDSLRETHESEPDFNSEFGYAATNALILYGDPTLRLR